MAREMPPIDFNNANDVLAWATVGLLVVALLAFIANVVLAVFTFKAVRATRRSAAATETAAAATQEAAVATQKEAEATVKEAEAATATVAEVRLDRELRYRPFLRWQVGGGVWIEGTNVGGGPALNAIFCSVHPNNWAMTGLRDLSPGEKLEHAQGVNLIGQNALPIPTPDVTGGAGLIAFCEDSAGNRYRFRDKHVTVDVWRPTENVKPAWVTWYEQRLQ